MAFAMLLAALLLFASMNRNDEENSSSKYSTITSTIKNSFTELLFKPDHLNNAQPTEEVSNTLSEKQSKDSLKQAIEKAQANPAHLPAIAHPDLLTAVRESQRLEVKDSGVSPFGVNK